MYFLFACVSFFILCTGTVVQSASPTVVMQRGPAHIARLPFTIVVIGHHSTILQDIARIIAQDMEWSGQFQVIVTTRDQKPTKQDISAYVTQGCPLVLFLNAHDTRSIAWRLYDTLQGSMLVGKRSVVTDGYRAVAHSIADALWNVVTNNKSCFKSSIAYCKEVSLAKGRTAKQVCVAEYTGDNERVLVPLPTIMVAPRWHPSSTSPLLFYSEYTSSNVRLMAVDMQGCRKIVVDADGVNMLPAISPDGKKFLYCSSHGKSGCQIYYGDAARVHKITDNEGNNIAPTFTPEGTAFYFCSDYEVGKPQIYKYTFDTKTTSRITKDGYCASPNCSVVHGKLVYGKMMHGSMQIFIYDPRTNMHEQLTHDNGSKDECCWSPCGEYVLYSVEEHGASRLAVRAIATGDQRYITPAGVNCSYPTWSLSY